MRRQHDILWALIWNPEQECQDGALLHALLDIPEDHIPVAVSQGWRVLATDSEIRYASVNVQRTEDDGA